LNSHSRCAIEGDRLEVLKSHAPIMKEEGWTMAKKKKKKKTS